MELEFRDGKRAVTPHIYSLLRNKDTYRMTYEEALHLVNRDMVSGYINAEHGKIINRHFKEHG